LEHAWRFGYAMTRICRGWRVLKWRNWGGERECGCGDDDGRTVLKLKGMLSTCWCAWHFDQPARVWLNRGAVVFVSILWTWTWFLKGYSVFLFTVSAWIWFLWIFLAMQLWMNLLDCVIRGSWKDNNSCRGHHSYIQDEGEYDKHNDCSLLKNNYHWSNIDIPPD